ncbi:hypothetical protein [Nocardia brasiliensis]|uniref:hypothetical protein n=1 Tax=Nocardia brasiliensis TaxID=37326 RepID=UPI0024566C07|nr:hypothetical protein [Nocardia brasiliensis]
MYGAPDIWNGKTLPVRNLINNEIHYRIYDSATGALLSFGTTNLLDVVLGDAMTVQADHPGVRLFVAQVDGAAWE